MCSDHITDSKPDPSSYKFSHKCSIYKFTNLCPHICSNYQCPNLCSHCGSKPDSDTESNSTTEFKSDINSYACANEFGAYSKSYQSSDTEPH